MTLNGAQTNPKFCRGRHADVGGGVILIVKPHEGEPNKELAADIVAAGTPMLQLLALKTIPTSKGIDAR